MIRALSLLLALSLPLSAEARRTNGVDWELLTEPVADVGEAGFDPGTFWGFHQSIVVRSGEHVYAALMDARGADFDRLFRLFERPPDGAWRQVWATPEGTQMNQPPNLAVDGTGRVHLSFQLDEGFRYTSWMPGEDLSALRPTTPTRLLTYRHHYPYGSVAIDAAGTLFDLRSEYDNHYWFRRAADGAWDRGVAVDFERLPGTDIWDRRAYPFVIYDRGEVDILSVQDALDPAKIEAGDGFPYQFRVLDYFHTPALDSEPFTTTTIVDRRPGGTARHFDLLRDRGGTVHILYGSFEVENDWNTTGPLTHAFGPPGGPFTHVPLGPFQLGRLWEAPDGTLWVITESGWQAWGAPLGPDGAFAFDPVQVGFEPHFGGLFAVSPRAVVGGSPYLEGLYFELIEGTHGRIHYYRASPRVRTVTAVTDEAAATPGASALLACYPNPFNGEVVVPLRLGAAGRVVVELFDLRGARVRRLHDGALEAGSTRLRWDGRDDGGAPVASGVYVVRLLSAGSRQTRRLALIR